MRVQGYNLEEVLQDCAGGVRSCSHHHSEYAQDQVVVDILSFLPLRKSQPQPPRQTNSGLGVSAYLE